jgi:methionyl-tRNA formyltransferase
LENKKNMTKKDFRIVFMGTPEFASTILTGLIEHAFTIVGVITAPDKPAGRGQKIQESSVKTTATEHNLTVLQPTNLKDENFIHELKALNADLFVVVAFRMLPEIVWNMPPKGTINLHASLLPEYRGAAPINWAVINGETTTGVTTFFIEQEIDTGMVIEREALPISENETAGELHDRLMFLGKALVQKSVQQIMEGTVTRTPQEAIASLEELKAAPKIFKGDCEINWNQSVSVIHDFCRGLSPYPTAWTTIDFTEKKEKKTFKLFKAFKTTQVVKDSKTLVFTKEGILFPCSDYYLCVTELQPEGKKRMNHSEFSAGYSNFQLNVEK